SNAHTYRLLIVKEPLFCTALLRFANRFVRQQQKMRLCSVSRYSSTPCLLQLSFLSFLLPHQLLDFVEVCSSAEAGANYSKARGTSQGLSGCER
ncbi:hypothetical protein, partial [Massilia sp.]|uniref:hypothetical protein n=1 Tax=Massilia sp. TaxID=1882437 RepID=UPI0028A876F3